MTEYGVDVSHWNAIGDWGAVHGNGISFASVKVTESNSYVSPDASGQANGARAAGIAAGGYHFAQNDTSPEVQAQFFASECNARALLLPGSFVPMLDLEAAGLRTTADDFTARFIAAFRVYSGQSKIAVYSNGDWCRNVLHPDQWADTNVFLWIAVWNGDPGNPGWSHPRLALHQHTDAGTVPGINGNVDRDCTVTPFTVTDLTLGTGSTPAPPVTPPIAPSTYTVQPGDTLSAIAAMWGTTVSAVAVANGISDPNLIRVGQVLRKPGVNPAPIPPAGTYTVQAGDTVSGLAAAWGTTVAAIVATNHLADPNRIYVGQVLIKPSGGAPAQRAYTVHSGDTLSGIGVAVGVDWHVIASANGLGSPFTIYPGQVLVIP
jgi:LysM repeat protein